MFEVKHRRFNIPALLGVAGVAPFESELARRWARWLEIPILIAVLWLPFAWYAEAKGLISAQSLRTLDIGVWCVFLIEVLVLSALVRNRLLFWRQNWLNVLIVFGGLPLLFMQSDLGLAFLRILRLLLFVVVVIRMTRQSFNMLARHTLLATLSMALFLVLSIGTLVASIEPKFETIWDGLWWAVVTISTVGYGDLVPATAEERVLGAVLIMFGVVVLSMVTANVAAFLVGLRVDESSEEITREEVRHELLILQRLDEMNERFNQLERLVLEKQNQTHAERDSSSG